MENMGVKAKIPLGVTIECVELEKGGFLCKGNILISRRCQLHPFSATMQYHNSSTDAYNKKRS
jgi:hypothetical protein